MAQDAELWKDAVVVNGRPLPTGPLITDPPAEPAPPPVEDAKKR